jgi:hypothetical protein
MGKANYLKKNLPQGPLSLPHLTHDLWEKACSCYFGGGEKLACLVDVVVVVVVVDDDMMQCHYSSLYC